MTRYSAQQLRDGAVSFFGAFDFDERPAGISPRRLPAWTRAQLRWRLMHQSGRPAIMSRSRARPFSG